METFTPFNLVFFAAATAVLLYVSRASLRRPGSHGFYRFFVFEAILALTLLNLDRWFEEPFSLHQIISWVCLVLGLFLAIHGFWLLRIVGEPDSRREDSSLFSFEKTTTLVKVGAYKYIRHPLYSSLLLLAWGVFFKSPSFVGGDLAVVATAFLIATAAAEEAENIRHFGPSYREYIRQTKRFIPFVY